MERIELIAKYIGLSLLSKNMTVSPLKLQKLLYYIQAWYMVFYDKKLIFEDVPQAWVNGPVYPLIFNDYKKKAENMCDHLDIKAFSSIPGIDVNKAFQEISQSLDFDSEEQELIESIILLYGQKTQNELIFLTHAEKPWAEKRVGLAPYERSTREISLDTMYNYYSERHNRNKSKA